MKSFLILITLITGLTLGYSRDILFFYYQPSAEAPREGFLINGNKPEEVKFPKRLLSAPLRLPPGDLELRLSPVEKLTDEIADKVPTITIPKEVSRAIVILLDDPQNEVFPVKPIVINASPNEFPLGSTKIFNFSDHQIVGSLGDKEISIKAKTQSEMGAPVTDASTYPVKIYYLDDEKRRGLYSGYWRHYPKARVLLFAMPNAGNKQRPHITSVLDKNKNAPKAAQR